MPKQSKIQFTEAELRRLLTDIDRLDDLPVVPLSDEEVAEIETTYQSSYIESAETAYRQEDFEKLREEWMASVERLDSVLGQIKAVGLSRQEFVNRMRLDLAVLLKLELRQIKDIPYRAVERLANELKVSFRSAYLYLTQPPQLPDYMAASSKGKPTAGSVETWTEAITKK